MTKLFTATDVERAARLAATKASAGTAVEAAVTAAVRAIVETQPPYYSAEQLELFGEAVYARAQTHYREQVCDPAEALAEALEDLDG